MQVFYATQFVLPLPPGHRFPMGKYQLLRDRLAAELPRHRSSCRRRRPATANWRWPHAGLHRRRSRTARVDPAILREIGFPWSPAMAERARRSVGRDHRRLPGGAARRRVAANIAGGTHHASADQGGGLLRVQRRRRRRAPDAGRVASRAQRARCRWRSSTSTCTRATARRRSSATTRPCSRSRCTAQKNFPFRKERSDLDVDLPDGCARRRVPARARAGAGRTVTRRVDPGPGDLPRRRRPARGRPPRPPEAHLGRPGRARPARVRLGVAARHAAGVRDGRRLRHADRGHGAGAGEHLRRVRWRAGKIGAAEGRPAARRRAARRARRTIPPSSARPGPDPRSAYPAFRPITTRWMDNDVYGHVNNVVYYSWFDTAVNAHLIEQGVLDIHDGDDDRPGRRDAVQLLRAARVPAAGRGRPARRAARPLERALRGRPVRRRRAADRAPRATSSTSMSTARAAGRCRCRRRCVQSWRKCNDASAQVTTVVADPAQRRRRDQQPLLGARVPAHASPARRPSSACSPSPAARPRAPTRSRGRCTCCRERAATPGREGLRRPRRDLRQPGAGAGVPRGIRLLPREVGVALHRPPPRERLEPVRPARHREGREGQDARAAPAQLPLLRRAGRPDVHARSRDGPWLAGRLRHVPAERHGRGARRGAAHLPAGGVERLREDHPAAHRRRPGRDAGVRHVAGPCGYGGTREHVPHAPRTARQHSRAGWS